MQNVFSLSLKYLVERIPAHQNSSGDFISVEPEEWNSCATSPWQKHVNLGH